ncbi:MAG: hypothetical protein LBV02_07585, partial [Bacteroidales bacterium]|nr:hypothetical protein [Bacteroidales bacterium]
QDFFPTLPSPVTTATLGETKHAEIVCWGVSPQAIHLFETLNEKHSTHFILPVWRDEHRYLSRREAGSEVLRKLTEMIPEISPSLIPQYTDSIKEMEKTIQQSPVPLLVKSPYSSSGRGLLWLWNGLGAKERELLCGMLRKQQHVSLEPILNKKLDFSLQYACDGNGSISLEGYSIFATNDKGAYIGSHLAPQSNLIGRITAFIPNELLRRVENELTRLIKHQYAACYKGCVGVDMMIYEENGEYKIHPCVEINMRYSMGYVALKIQQNYLSPGATGVFRIDHHPQPGKALRIHQELHRRHPLVIENNRIQSGYLSLCRIGEETRFVCSITQFEICEHLLQYANKSIF